MMNGIKDLLDLNSMQELKKRWADKDVKIYKMAGMQVYDYKINKNLNLIFYYAYGKLIAFREYELDIRYQSYVHYYDEDEYYDMLINFLANLNESSMFYTYTDEEEFLEALKEILEDNNEEIFDE